MKLRLRLFDSKETLRIEVPESSSFQHLKDIVSQALSSSPSSLHLSLNRKDELISSFPGDSLHSLGITSGDLIFYTFDASRISPKSSVSNSSEVQPRVVQKSETLSRATDIDVKKPRMEYFDVMDEDQALKSDPEGANLNTEEGTFPPISDSKAKQEFSGADSQLIVDEPVAMERGKYSSLLFRMRMPSELLRNDDTAHNLLVTAVHYVLLESGFLGFDQNSGSAIDWSHIMRWPSTSVTLTITYNLKNVGNSSNVTPTAVFKFQAMGKFLNIYGNLANYGKSGVYRVSLDNHSIVPSLRLIWASSGFRNTKNDTETYRESQVFEFWKIVKDRLVLPLLIDIHEKANLPLPPCFVRLPDELKMKILDSLTGVDVARVGCVSSELRNLSNNDDLWKKKFDQEFGYRTEAEGMGSWKERFGTFWEKMKNTHPFTSSLRMARGYDPRGGRSYFPVRMAPNPFGVPLALGGDYDRFPGVGIPSRNSRDQGHPGLHFWHSLIPNCHLGGFNV